MQELNMTLQEVQKMELEILLDIDRFCRERKIPYTLWAGSMLGAARHKGFIPWDDDIDIAMPRPYYERFIREYTPENGAKFRILSALTHKNYPYYISRVDNPTTRIDLEICKFKDCGLCVDILPLDGMSASPRVQKITRWLAVKLKDVKYWKNHYVELRLKNLHKLVIPGLLPWRTVKWLYDRLLQRYPFEGSPYFCCLAHALERDKANSWPASAVSEFVEVPFEGHPVFIAKGYDTVLTMLYGDYMTPPPADKRNDTHLYRIRRLSSGGDKTSD